MSQAAAQKSTEAPYTKPTSYSQLSDDDALYFLKVDHLNGDDESASIPASMKYDV
jgi:hypothetical protein